MTIYNETITETLDESSNSTYTSYLLVTNDIEMHGYPDPSLPHMPVSDGIIFGDSSSFTNAITILESLLLNSSVVTSVQTADAITEYINLLDELILTFSAEVSETLSLAGAITVILNNTQLVTESLEINGTVSEKVVFLNVLSELINIIDSNAFGLKMSITESLVFTDTVSTLYNAILTLSESLVLSLSESNSYINIVSLSESLNLDETLESNGILQEVVSETFIISIPTATGQDTYLAYTFAPENNAVTTYTNYDFDGCTKFNGKYYFFNSTGLYEYGGETDAGSVIRAILTTAGLTFGTSNKKTIPQVYLGATNSDELIMKVRVDGKAECIYRLKKYTNDLDTQKIKVGKGVIGRYFQFEFITEANEFNLESIEFFPIVLKRKL